MTPFAILLGICLLSIASHAKSKPYPLIVLPPFLRLNSSNSITVTSLQPDQNVDVKIYLRVGKLQICPPIKAKAIRPGVPHTSFFHLIDKYDSINITVDVTDHSKYHVNLFVRPDLYSVHLHTDKNTYRAGETVQLRVLPLTHQGKPYLWPLELVLINSEGFQLLKKLRSADEELPVISESFELPEHLFFGDWKIIARPEGVTDSQLTFAAKFQVKEYELPAFKLSGHIDDSGQIDETGVTIEARYFHGVPINGTFTISCYNSSIREEDRLGRDERVKAGELHNGIWTHPVNLTKCYEGSNFKDQILIEVRDYGSGARADLRLLLDALSPRFSLVPMRPFFSPSTNKLLLIVDSELAGSVTVIAECVTAEQLNGEVSTEMIAATGTVAGIEISREWRKKCSVIKVTGKRKLKRGYTREKTLFVPNLRNTSLSSNFINLDEPKPAYQIGDVLPISLQASDADKLNYMVLCNSQVLSKVEGTRDDRKLHITIDENMKGSCVLFVFTTMPALATDMLLFRVVDNCQGSINVARVVDGEKYDLPGPNSSIEPAQQVQVQLRGLPYGLAVYRAIDDRMNHLALQNEAVKDRYWDFSMFGRTISEVYYTRILNLIDMKEVQKKLSSECEKAGNRLYTKCPEFSFSTSVLSNICLLYLRKGCNPQPKVFSVCDKRNPKTCQKEETPMPNVVQSSFFFSSEFHDAGLLDSPTTLTGPVRENFHEVWLFDAVPLGADGTAQVETNAPDNIGEWALTSAFWSRGRTSMCPANTFYIKSKKSIFLEVIMPRDVYVNETVTVMLTVTGLNIQKLSKFSICIADLPRKVCADEGSFGHRGKPDYTNVALSPNNTVQAKQFSMRFLVAGKTNVTFVLREEKPRPEKHHCEGGKILDTVRLHINIAKRADTVEYYKRVLLNAEKPVLKLMMSDDAHNSPASVAIGVSESRLPNNPSEVVTTIAANILDTETVYSFSIDLSKFLPTEQFFEDTQTRSRRGVVDSGRSFLSDVIKALSVELYHFKSINHKSTELYRLQWAEKRISNLIADVLRFSDCSSQGDPCGFAEYGAPRNPNERSIFLTSIATSLLCEASVDDKLVLGPMKTIIEQIPKLKDDSINIDLHDIVEIKSPYDRKLLMASVMFQVSKDCAIYHDKIKDEVKYENFSQLHKYYYSFDESKLTDVRTVAAVAFMASNVTQELMRSVMMGRIRSDMEPFWSAGNVHNKPSERKSTFEVISSKNFRSGDVMVNSLGLLAFITAGAEDPKIEWDPLADWLFKQQDEDGGFESPIDTYFASRALYEYRLRKVDIEHNHQLQVKVECSGCPTRVINLTESAIEVNIPTQVRTVTMTTGGFGKAKAEVRIVATRRQRQRRELTQDDYYPVRIKCEQHRIEHSTTIRQAVCLTVLSPVIKTLEITHGLYTGYSSSTRHLAMLQNSSDVTILNPATSSYAMHFVIKDLPHNRPVCYTLGVSEPSDPTFAHLPFQLAPVAIQARHPISDVVGLLLIAHPDVEAANRRRRSHKLRHHHSSARTIRSIIDQTAVDTVCFEGGQCTCAETTCEVRCRSCDNYKERDVRNYLSGDDHFGIRVKVKSVSEMSVQGTIYSVFQTEVLIKAGRARDYLLDSLSLLLRKCNQKCLPKGGKINKEHYLLLGHIDGLALDSNGTSHYVLRGSDRFEEATADCGELNNAITLEDN